MSVLTGKQMGGLTPIQQAENAIEYLLRTIKSHSCVGYYLGSGSQCFSLLTEAYATLKNLDVAAVHAEFACENPVNPQENVDDSRECCCEDVVFDDLDKRRVIALLELFPENIGIHWQAADTEYLLDCLQRSIERERREAGCSQSLNKDSSAL